MSHNWKIIALALTLMMPITLIGRHYYGYGYGPYPYGYAYGPYYGYPYAGPVVYTDNGGAIAGSVVGATLGGLFGGLASR
jgi:hypothetical protein